MDTVWNGHLVGTFYGYKGGSVYRLSDGSKWKQEDATDEPACIEGPGVRLLTRRGSGVIYLAVDEASSMVRVSLLKSPVRAR